jgi:Replication-relaxation
MTLRTYHTRQRAARVREQLAPLDVTLVETLASVAYASTRQLEALCLPDALGPARARRVRRRLARLAELKVVYQVRRPIGGLGGGSDGSVWTLERTGYALVDHPLPHRDLRPARERGLAFLRHALAVSQLRVDLEHHARGRSGVRVAAWVTEPASRITYRDPGTGRLAHITPDALCEVHTPTIELRSALEVDMGSEGRTSLERKAARYLAYASRHPDAPQVVWSFTTLERAAMFAVAVDRAFRQPAIRALLRRGLFVITTPAGASTALCGENDE